MQLFSLLIVLLLSQISLAKNDVIFEGYYKLLASKKAVGYVVLRYEFDKDKKQFFSKSYIRGNAQAGNLQESLIAVSDDQFRPINYKYTSSMNNSLKSIDAKFKKTKSGSKMTAVISDGKSSKTINKDIDKKTFLSTFQVFLMLQKGLTPGTQFDFTAISEEDASVHSGVAKIKTQAGFEGKGILRVENVFNGSKYISNLNKDGEILITEAPAHKIQTQLVAMPAEATKGFPYDLKSLKLIFGDIPRGQKNVLARNRLKKMTTVKADNKSNKEKKTDKKENNKK